MPVNSDSYLDDLPSGRLYHQPRVLAPQTQDEQYRPIEDANVIGGPVGMGPDHHPAYNGIRQAIGEMLNAATRLEAIHRRLGRWPNYFEKYQEHRAMTPHGCSYCHRHWHDRLDPYLLWWMQAGFGFNSAPQSPSAPSPPRSPVVATPPGAPVAANEMDYPFDEDSISRRLSREHEAANARLIPETPRGAVPSSATSTGAWFPIPSTPVRGSVAGSSSVPDITPSRDLTQS